LVIKGFNISEELSASIFRV